MLTGAIKLAIRCYQYTFGAVLPGACRFEPTCSEYALQALSVHGLARGGWLTVKRLARCHPFGGCGFDPVPDRNRRIDSKSRTVKSAGTKPDGKADIYMTGERI